MKYFASIGETEYECVIDESNGALVISVGDRDYTVDLKHIPSSKAYTLLLDGLSYEFTLEEDDGLIECAGGAGLFHVRVEDARTHAARAKTLAARGAGGPKVVKAVMPGIVLRHPPRETGSPRVAGGRPRPSCGYRHRTVRSPS